ncbi:MAG TPA: DedA family protein [Clostridiales bacterium]|jgi:membrane protein DedA with SNARE-associated domain|nr:DedA family protein [Clostridiales bacterium]
MQEWIIQTMEQFGYLGIFLLITIENLFPPIPSEIILTFGGFMTTYTSLHVWGVILSATIGSVLGAIILYGIGRLLSVDLLAKILDGKIGKILRFKKEDVFKACDWFNSKGKKTVLLCRCVPIVRSLISIPAGMAKMKFGIFLVLTTIGSFVWNIVLVYLGAAAGEAWEKIVAGTDTYQTITIIILGVIAVGILFWYLRFRKERNNKEDK